MSGVNSMKRITAALAALALAGGAAPALAAGGKIKELKIPVRVA